MKAYENTQRSIKQGRQVPFGLENQSGSIKSGEGEGSVKVEAGVYTKGPRKGQSRLSHEDEMVFIRQKSRDCYSRNKEKILTWRRDNKDRLTQQRILFNKRHPKSAKQRAANWRREFPDRAKASLRKQYLKNQEERKAISQKWRDDNPEKAKLWQEEYKKRKPEVYLAAGHRRRSRVRGVEIRDSQAIKDWIQRIRESDFVKCYWCLTLSEGKKIQMDHIVPIANGGANSLDNLCASCPSCNLSKKAKSIPEWNKRLLQPVLL